MVKDQFDVDVLKNIDYHTNFTGSKVAESLKYVFPEDIKGATSRREIKEASSRRWLI